MTPPALKEVPRTDAFQDSVRQSVSEVQEKDPAWLSTTKGSQHPSTSPDMTSTEKADRTPVALKTASYRAQHFPPCTACPPTGAALESSMLP